MGCPFVTSIHHNIFFVKLNLTNHQVYVILLLPKEENDDEINIPVYTDCPVFEDEAQKDKEIFRVVFGR